MFAYLDPGTGITFFKESLFLLLFLGGTLSFLLLFSKIIWRFIVRFRLFFILAVILLAIGGIIMLKGKNQPQKKVLILGIDAMDPEITKYLLNSGKLPNFMVLKEKGYYSKLKTVIPAESCVVWTCFATGAYPADCGIFDFIMRDPQTYMPYLSLNEVVPDVKFIKIGKFKIPISKKLKARNLVKKESFWNVLSNRDIPVSVYFHPNTFPAEKICGKMVSGMGVPDLYGTMGRFLFYSENKVEDKKDSRGKIIQVNKEGNIIKTFIYGPKIESKGETEESKIPLDITVNAMRNNIGLKLGKDDFIVQKGEWSSFHRVVFKISAFKNIRGIVKFYLKSVEPLELYCSPVNIDPLDPIFPISYPIQYSAKLAKAVGLYHTQGMPHDTWAFVEGRLDEKAFLQHVDDILNEKVKILNKALKEFHSGVLFFYVDTLDIMQHLFWRQMKENNSQRIYDYYIKMDQILANILGKIDKDTTLIVLSDHGFKSFDYTVDLNCWLYKHGYLVMKEGINESDGFFKGVDWNKTQAYALGFGSIYINKFGREKFGIVMDEDYKMIKTEIKDKLLEMVNPDSEESVISKVYTNDEVFSGTYEYLAPDLYAGFYPGYRVSWQTALGGLSDNLIAPNTKLWSGTHLIDPEFVPGVIFSNQKLHLNSPAIVDIAPIVTKMYQ